MTPVQEQLNRLETKIDAMRREVREDSHRMEDNFKQWQEKQDDKLDAHDKLHGTHNITLAEIKTRVFVYAAMISTACGIIGSGVVAFIVKKYS